MSGVDCLTRRRSYTPNRSSRAIRGMRRRHAEVVPNEQSESECSPDAWAIARKTPLDVAKYVYKD